MTPEYRVQYAPQAFRDIEAIYAYIAFELMAEQAALNQTNRIRAEIRKLRYYPEKHTGVQWEPWASLGMRFVPVDRYNVYYCINDAEATVTVTRIVYSGRDIKNILMEE